jgi:hypothetical protein
MEVNGARTDDQLLGHLGIGEPLGHETEHLYFAGGQASWIGRGFRNVWNGRWSCWSRCRYRHGFLCSQGPESY